MLPELRMATQKSAPSPREFSQLSNGNLCIRVVLSIFPVTCRETVVRLSKLERALVRSLECDHLMEGLEQIDSDESDNRNYRKAQ